MLFLLLYLVTIILFYIYFQKERRSKSQLKNLLQKREEKNLAEKEKELNTANSKLVASIEKLKSMEIKLELLNEMKD